MAFYRAEPGGLLLFVRLTPRGGRDGIDGIVATADGRQAIAARVRAPPDKGAANTALIALLADEFGVKKAAVTIAAGAAARSKQIRVAGEAAQLIAIAEAWKTRG